MAEEVSFDVALEEWFQSIQKYANLSLAELATISSAGAAVYKKNLEEVTRRKHRSKHDDKVYGHMSDNIYQQAKNIDGEIDGTATVGFDPYHARNANILNSGSKYIHGDNFVTNTQENSIEEVLLAEKLAYDALMKKKGESDE